MSIVQYWYPTSSELLRRDINTTASTITHGNQVNASNTGVPSGVSLTPSSSMTITENGTTIDALDISGTVTINADNVTVKRCRIVGSGGYRVNIMGGTTGTIVEDCYIDSQNSDAKCVLVVGSATLRRLNVSGAEDGIFVLASNTVVEECYVHHIYLPPEGHSDCFQIRSGDNVTLRRNNFQAYNPTTGQKMNASIQAGSLNGTDQISNFLVEDNLMNGGNYTVNGGGRGETDSSLYRGNRFGHDYLFGPVANLNAGEVWEATNVWDDTGLPV